MVQSIFAVIKMLFEFLFFLTKVVAVAIFPFVLSCIIFYIYYYRKGKRIKKPTIKSTYKKTPLLKKLFFDFPQRFILDLFARNPDAFFENGLHLFAGEQGSGKTIASIEMSLRLKKTYPMLKLRSNIKITFQDGKINDWRDIVFNNNGIHGQIDFIDEIQAWFNSNNSKNFPPEMLTEVCQQRKQTKCIIGTSQVFKRVAKPIREQVKVLYEPLTILNCFTIVRVYKPTVDDEGSLKKKRLIRTYCFVHSKELREAYDTMEKVKSYTNVGFKPLSEQYHNYNIPIVSVDIDTKAKK